MSTFTVIRERPAVYRENVFDTLATLRCAALFEARGNKGAIQSLVRYGKKDVTVGRARTVACEPYDSLGVQVVLGQCEPGDVVVIGSASPTPLHCFLGDVMALQAAVRGVAALVVDGYILDVDGLNALDLLVCAKGSLLAPGRTTGAYELDATITIDGTPIVTGDVVVIDGDGIVVIPDDELAAVVETASRKVAAENELKARIYRGEILGSAHG